MGLSGWGFICVGGSLYAGLGGGLYAGWGGGLIHGEIRYGPDMHVDMCF